MADAKSKNPYYQGPISDHFDGTRFFNPGGIAPLGFRALMRWQFNGERQRWAKEVESPFAQAKPDARVSGDGMRITMAGHASMLVQVAGLNILTDPVWSDRASPFSFAGPKRVTPPGIRFEDLPDIDLVLVSHNHYDHLDMATLKRLQAGHKPHFITPLGNDTIIRRAVPDARISVMDWGDRLPISDGIAIDAEPAHHWSARGTGDRSMALWAAFVVSTPSGKIYHVGDTGFHDGINYRAAGEKHGGFRLAILPFGAYEPRWFMLGQHQNPDEAVKGMQFANASYVAGHHFATFQLTDEAIGAPVSALAIALLEQGVAAERFRPLRAGEVFDVPVV
jgi:L-ascorbate metabolism protein UlaG (beta-lactamase superfamily)